MSATRKANEALVAAAWELSVDKMRSALAAGANPLHHCFDGYNCRGPVAALVTTVDEWEKFPGVDVDAMKVAALRLLGEHGGLDEDTLASCMSRGLRHKCSATIVQQLLAAGAEITTWWLHLAHRADVARLLIAAGADVTSKLFGKTILHSAAAEPAEPAVFAVFADAGVDVNAVSSHGETALDRAICVRQGTDCVPAVTALLELGADPFAGLCKDGNVLQYLVDRFVDSIGFARRAVLCGAVVRLIARAAAWHRRRHMLLAVRCRYDRPAASAPAAYADGTAATGGAAGS